MGRAEAYAGKYPPIPSFFDGLGMGLALRWPLILIGGIREIIGGGHFLRTQGDSGSYVPVNIFVLALALPCAGFSCGPDE